MQNLKSLSNQQLMSAIWSENDSYLTSGYNARLVKKSSHFNKLAQLNQERVKRGMHELRLTNPDLIQEKLDKKQQLIEDSFNEPSIIGQAVEIPKDIVELEAIQRLTRLFSL